MLSLSKHGVGFFNGLLSAGGTYWLGDEDGSGAVCCRNTGGVHRLSAGDSMSVTGHHGLMLAARTLPRNE